MNQKFIFSSFLKSVANLDYAGTAKVVISLNNENFYTDDKIKDNFLECIHNQDLLQPAQKDISRLIDSEKIIPIMTSKGVISKIRKFYKAPIENNMILGFFNSKTERIYILMENQTDFVFWSKSDSVSSVLIHELQHFTSFLFPKEFMNVHSKSLLQYYRRFFDLYFEVRISDVDIRKYYTWVFENIEVTGADTVAVLVRYANMLESIMSGYRFSPGELFSLISNYMSVIKTYLQNSDDYIKLLEQRDKKAVQLFTCLFKAYKAINIPRPETLSIQETMFPSEIICIESQNNTLPKHYQLISKIK